MLGAILGDMIGSYYEIHPEVERLPSMKMKWHDYSDDTVLTVATMEALLNNEDYAKSYRNYFMNNQERDYGRRFIEWARDEKMPAYGSYGNGAAMRISPIAFMAENECWLEKEVYQSATVSHNHPAALTGAQAIAFCIFWLKEGKDKRYLKKEVERRFHYDLDFRIIEIRKSYTFDASASGSVPQAIKCFLESENLMQAIGNAVYLGGDMDTIAGMAGALGEAAYGIKRALANTILSRLPKEYQNTVKKFYNKSLARRL
ncbi:ADP-ribosylglycohydrolase family protein [Clostridia bacterium]|nr:ADP-ribosylglycohydrolase family protein [Clostridia bacterium]